MGKVINSSHPAEAPSFVGRTEELELLYRFFEQMLAGTRQVVFITGEAGIGKSALVKAFVAQAIRSGEYWVAEGAWPNSDGHLMEALQQLCQQDPSRHVRDVLKQTAPSWLLRLSPSPPMELTTDEIKELRLHTGNIKNQRRLNELAEALETLSHERPFLLVLEDLHHSDASTLEMLHHLAQRSEKAKLFILGTSRSGESRRNKFDQLKRDLLVHRHCQVMDLPRLPLEAVQAYLIERWGDEKFVPSLAAHLYARTKGHALFTFEVVRKIEEDGIVVQEDGHWRKQESFATLEIPNSVQEFIEGLIVDLPEEDQRLLEAASVVGVEFVSAAVAAVLNRSIEDVEERCQKLKRQGRFIAGRDIEAVKWPDGTYSSAYYFRHQLYQERLYARISPGQRIQWHQRIAERLEQGYQQRTQEIAPQLAVHFEQGKNPCKTVHYLRLAAEQSLFHNAYREAHAFAEQGLGWFKTLAETEKNDLKEEELGLQSALGTALIPIKGPGDDQVKNAYARARELCEQLGDSTELVHILFGLHRYYNFRGEHQEARRLAERMRALTEHSPASRYRPWACISLGETSWYLGKLEMARDQLTEGIACYQPQLHDSLLLRYGTGNFPVAARDYKSVAEWYLGYPEQANTSLDEARRISNEQDSPFSQVFRHLYETIFHQFLGDPDKTKAYAEITIDFAKKYEFVFQRYLCTMLQGWALVMQGQNESIKQMRQAFQDYEAIDGRVGRPYFLGILAEALGQIGKFSEAQEELAEAFQTVEKTGERFYEAELYRISGDLVLKQLPTRRLLSRSGRVQRTKTTTSAPQHTTSYAEAEKHFLKAIEIAHNQEAKSLELRAVMNLSRLWQLQGRIAEARQRLQEIYE
jgi:tetratricopeptide (TPR) repeat protein